MPSSKALDKFRKTILRCERLVVEYEAFHALITGLNQQGGNHPLPPKDMVRGAVVLGVAALDAYVTDVFTEKLVSYLKKYSPGEDLITLLSDAGLDTRMTLKLIDMERPYRGIRTLINKHFERYTTQKFYEIDKLFRNYSLTKISKNAAGRSGKPSIKRSVELLVDRRNQIAHSGDYNAHNKITSIDEKVIAKRLKDLEILVKNMDELICNRI